MKYFTASEFDCKCGCGLNNFSESLAETLDILRAECGFPFVISSGCRCTSHNYEEGGTPRSDHLTGEGVDIKAIGGNKKYLIITHALEHEICRIGIGKSFVHLGTNKSNPQDVFWTY